MAAKKKSAPAPSADMGLLTDLLDRVTGKESSLALDLDDVGVDLGEGRKVVLRGRVRLSLSSLK